MKLNEFKKAKLNELDLSSFLGDYGSAAVRSGLGSLGGKNVLSSTDQMAKDDFIKKFNSRALSGLQSAIDSGLVDMAAKGSTTPQATPQANTGALSPEQIRKQKQAAASAVAQQQMAQNPAVTPTAGRNVSPTPAQTRQQKLATASTSAQGQMAPFSKLPANQAAVQAGNIRQQKQGAATTAAQGQMTPVSKLPADQFAKSASNVRQAQQGQAAQGQMTPKVAGPTPKTPEQIRQAKQLAATQAAQGQMNPMNKLPADQFNKSAANVRQQQQGVATQNAQDQMSPVSKLPADQFAKSADNVRQQQQTTATQTAQQQMAAPQGYQSSDPRFPNGKYDGVTGKPTPEYQAELDKWTSDSAKKQKADAAASQSQAKSNDDMQAQNNPAPVAQEPTKTAGPTVVTTDPAEVKAAMKAKIDAMKEKNPKLAAQMAAMGMDDEFNDKLNNATKTKKNNKTNAGNQAFGQMAQNLSKVNEGSRFDKLNYLFESILAEQDPAQGSTKQSISQYITNFFKQFMKGVNISDPTVTTQVATLAKELEQTYSKDKGKSAIPKLADLAWSVSHAEGGQEPQQATTTPAQTGATPSSASAAATSNTTPQSAQASTQQAKMTATQITKLMKGLSTRQKQSVLKNLQTQLSKTPPSNKKQVSPSKRIGFLPEENPPARNIQKQQK